MKKFLCVLLLMAVGFAGCAKKEEAAAPGVENAKKMLIEGTVFLKQGEPAKAIQNFATAIKTAPDYFEGYYLLAETLIRLKQFTQAEAILAATVKKFPDNGVGYYLLAVAHEGAGNVLPAVLAARKSVDIFTVKGDKEGTMRATILLGAFVSSAKQQSEANAVANAENDAKKAASASAGQLPVAQPVLPAADKPESSNPALK
ncbi:MAG: tetratricopeptide repeat protein [Candidatus Omnitrophica bacterium]|nr:tetratricopeptide repeat protein [Candidatus Omnitrophota bacterium]